MRNVGQWLTRYTYGTKIGVEYVHALKMVDRFEGNESCRSPHRPYLKTPSEYSVHEASFVLATGSFAAAFSREKFRADTNTFNQPSHPSQPVGDAFLSLPRAGGSLARLPTLVTKTNGMYLFHATPASGFLLSPLCIALVKHFFLPSSPSPRLSSSFFFPPSLPLSSFRRPSFFHFSSFTRLLTSSSIRWAFLVVLLEASNSSVGHTPRRRREEIDAERKRRSNERIRYYWTGETRR